MKKNRSLSSEIAIFFVCLFLLGLTSTVSARPFAVYHDLAVTIHPEAQQLTGLDKLKLKVHDAQELLLLLANDARLISVSLAEDPAPYTFERGQVRIPLPERLRNGEIELAISYEAFFRDPVPMNPLHTEDPSYGVTGVISSQGVFLLPGAGWYPHVPGSKPTFRLRVEAPAGFEAVTAGKPVVRKSDAKTTTSVWQVTNIREGIALSAGPYAVRVMDAEGIPVYSYFFHEDDHLAPRYLEAVAGYLRLYNVLLGPYPFEKFAVVENFFPTGYGFPSYTLLGKTVIRLPFIVETSLGHEVAHAWWGNGVLIDYGDGNWAEGLTSYVADYLYKERSSPQEARDYRLKILRDYATLVSPEEDFPLKAFLGRVSPSTRVVGYGKAAMVFHMARRLVGDEAFWKGLRRVFQEKLFQEASWDDFSAALSWAGDQDLNPFFRQWVARAGAPTLVLEDMKISPEKAAWQVTGRLHQQAPYFDLRVPVRLETKVEKKDITVLMTGQRASFALRTDTFPKRLVVDPDVDLFRRLYPSEVPPVVNGVKGSQSLAVVASRRMAPKTVEAAAIIIKALGHREVPVMSEDEVASSHLTGRDVLYLGLPQKRALLSLPEHLVLGGNHFAIDGVTYDEPGDALFAVFSHPQEKKRVVSIFLPLSSEAAQKAVRKIPHYGKYSYLVFRSGINQTKGTWPVTVSPLIHFFNPEEGSP